MRVNVDHVVDKLQPKTVDIQSLQVDWQTQEKFISVLMLLAKSPSQVFELVEASDLPPTIFLLHLMLIADHGRELIDQLSKKFKTPFPYDAKTKKYFFRFLFAGKQKRYVFKALPSYLQSGASLNIGVNFCLSSSAFDDLSKDLTMLLLYAGGKFASDKVSSSQVRFNIGKLIGKTNEIERYVRQRYTQILLMSHMRLH